MISAARALHNAWLWRTCASRLRRARSGLVGADEVLDLAFSFDCRGVSIAPFQMRSEARALMAVVERERPSTVLEVGTANGGTLFLLSRCAPADATLVSIDMEGGPFGGGYPPWRGRLYETFAEDGQAIHLIRGDSHSPDTARRVDGLLRGRPLDLLFIDGDHSYEGASRDLELYGPMVREGGVIALHDIVPGPESVVGGVPRLWAELRGRYPHEELVEDWGQVGCGIGMVRQPGGGATVGHGR